MTTIPNIITDLTTTGDDTFVFRVNRRLPTDVAGVKTTVFFFGGIMNRNILDYPQLTETNVCDRDCFFFSQRERDDELYKQSCSRIFT